MLFHCKDLNDASAPFQSAEALKEFRDKQLGILTQEESENILQSSSLSATAAAFVPRASVVSLVYMV